MNRRAVLVALAVTAAIVLVTLAAGLIPDGPRRCDIPGHAHTTVIECEDHHR